MREEPSPPGRPRVLVMFPFFNEEGKLEELAARFGEGECRTSLADTVLAVNDGSTDGGPDFLRRRGFQVLDKPRGGIGTCIKRAIRYGLDHGFDVLVVMAGNGKDDPREIPRLLAPILERGADYVQGSRFLAGGESPNLPLFRRLSIRWLSLLFSLYTRRPCTDLTNGFRAYKLALLDDPRIDVWQDWLDTYEYEYYLHFKAYTLGYRVEEVPVTKAYPADKAVSYSKIRPFSDWWRMLRPLVYLALGLKK